MGGPDMAPQPPQRSEHPGEAVALLDTPPGFENGGARHGPPTPPEKPRRSKPCVTVRWPATAAPRVDAGSVRRDRVTRRDLTLLHSGGCDADHPRSTHSPPP